MLYEKPKLTQCYAATSIGNAEDLVTKSGYAVVAQPTPGPSLAPVPEQNASTADLDSLIQTVESDSGQDHNVEYAKQMLTRHQESAGQLLKDLDQEIPETNSMERLPS